MSKNAAVAGVCRNLRRLEELEQRTGDGTATPAEAGEFAALITSREPWATSPAMAAWMSGATCREACAMAREERS